MATEFIKLDITILYVIKKLKNQHQRADIECIFDEVTKTIDFQHTTKASFNDRVNQLPQSNKLTNKINRSKDSFFLNEDIIDMSIIHMISYIQNSPPSKILDTFENILDSFETTPSLCTQMNLIETPKKSIFKKSMQNQLQAVIRERDKKLYELKNSDNKNSEPKATNNNGETQGKYPDGTPVIIRDSILNGIIQERLSRKARIVKVPNV